MGSLMGNCEVRNSTTATAEFPHTIATTCSRPAEAELDLTLPACPEQPGNPPLVFRVRLCSSHLQAYTGWH